MLELVQRLVYNQPWLISESGLNLITGIVEAHLSGVRLSPAEAQAKADSRQYGTAGAEAPKQVALINLHGPIMNRSGDNMMLSGSTDPQAFARVVRAAADNPDIGRIVISVDSPGGTVAGTRAAGDAVAYARSKKDVVAVADELAASAAYWIACQATTLVATPGAVLGSISVIMAMKDTSGKEAKDGIQTHVLRSGPLKALGQPGEVITDETLAHYAETMNTFHEQFVQAVASGLQITSEQASKLATGQTWIGQGAVDAGVAHRVGTLQGALLGEYSSQAAPALARPAARAASHTPTGGTRMDPAVLAMLGLSADATAQEILAAIKQREVTAATTQQANMLAALGLTAETGTEADLKAFARQAADGAAYRADLLEQMGKLTITTEGNGPEGIAASERVVKVYASADVEVLAAEVARLEAKRDNLPNAALSQHGTDTKPAKKLPSMAAFGFNPARR